MNMSGTTDMIRIYSQNVRKNYVLLDSLLESQKDLYDILFFRWPFGHHVDFGLLLLFAAILNFDNS